MEFPDTSKYSPSHPLHGCILRVERADRYIKEANGYIRTFESECEDLVVANAEAKTGFKFPDVPEQLPLAVSDAIQNLRASLDYLVYELALMDSNGVEQSGTQFPNESVKSGRAPDGNKFGFDAVVNRFLKGVSQAHRDAIEDLQPYNRKKWAQTLKEISNPDKHRRLVPIHKGSRIDMWISGPNGRGKTLPNGDTVQVNAHSTILIQLEQRRVPVVQTLYEIEVAIMDVINAFEPEFKV